MKCSTPARPSLTKTISYETRRGKRSPTLSGNPVSELYNSKLLCLVIIVFITTCLLCVHSGGSQGAVEIYER